MPLYRFVFLLLSFSLICTFSSRMTFVRYGDGDDRCLRLPRFPFTFHFFFSLVSLFFVSHFPSLRCSSLGLLSPSCLGRISSVHLGRVSRLCSPRPCLGRRLCCASRPWPCSASRSASRLRVSTVPRSASRSASRQNHRDDDDGDNAGQRHSNDENDFLGAMVIR